MRKVNTIVLTKQLNQLRMQNPELKVSQFREEISKYIGYNTFSSLLLEEGYAYSINGTVRFSPTPIHKTKVEALLKEARETQVKYNEKSLQKKKEKNSILKKELIESAITLLKSNGFIVIKQEDIL